MAFTRLARVAALCCVQFVDVLGVTVVVTALPTMLRDLSVPTSASSLVVTAYAMFFGGLLMFGARIGDRFGHRRTVVGSLLAYAVASLLTGSASWIGFLIAGRCLQGAAAAGTVPSALRLLSSADLDNEQRQRALAAWSATGAVAGASGFVVGGLVTQVASWRLIFWTIAPLALFLALAIWRMAPAGGNKSGKPLDVAGAALLTAAVMALVVGSSFVQRPPSCVLGAILICVGILILVTLLRLEKVAPDPLLPATVWRDWNLRTGLLGAFLNTATTSSAMTIATLYLQDGRGLSAAAAGLLLMPFSVLVVGGSIVSAPLLRRRPSGQVAALGLGVIAFGNLTLFLVPALSWMLPACVAFAGLGIGMSSVAATNLALDVPEVLRGTAAGLVNTAAQIGTALGVAIFLLIASAAGGAATAIGARLGWAGTALLALGGAIKFSLTSTSRLTSEPSPPSQLPSHGKYVK